MKKFVLCLALLFTLSIVSLAFGQATLSLPVKEYVAKEQVDKAKDKQDKVKKDIINKRVVDGETVSNTQTIQKSIPSESTVIKLYNTK